MYSGFWSNTLSPIWSDRRHPQFGCIWSRIPGISSYFLISAALFVLAVLGSSAVSSLNFSLCQRNISEMFFLVILVSWWAWFLFILLFYQWQIMCQVFTVKIDRGCNGQRIWGLFKMKYSVDKYCSINIFLHPN